MMPFNTKLERFPPVGPSAESLENCVSIFTVKWLFAYCAESDETVSLTRYSAHCLSKLYCAQADRASVLICTGPDKVRDGYAHVTCDQFSISGCSGVCQGHDEHIYRLCKGNVIKLAMKPKTTNTRGVHEQLILTFYSFRVLCVISSGVRVRSPFDSKETHEH